MLVRPAVGGSPGNVKAAFDPSAESCIFVMDIVPATLRTELDPQPVEQWPHVLLGKTHMLLPSGFDRRFELPFVQLFEF